MSIKILTILSFVLLSACRADTIDSSNAESSGRSSNYKISSSLTDLQVIKVAFDHAPEARAGDSVYIRISLSSGINVPPNQVLSKAALTFNLGNMTREATCTLADDALAFICAYQITKNDQSGDISITKATLELSSIEAKNSFEIKLTAETIRARTSLKIIASDALNDSQKIDTQKNSEGNNLSNDKPKGPEELSNPPVDLLSDPVDLAIAAMSSDSVTLIWKNPERVPDSYTLSFRSGNVPPISCADGTVIRPAGTPFTRYGLDPLTSYSFRVCGNYPNGTSSGMVLAGKTLGPVQTFQEASLVLGQPSMEASMWANPSSQSFAELDQAVPFSANKILYIPDHAGSRILIWNPIPAANFQKASAVLGQNNKMNTTIRGRKLINFNSPLAVKVSNEKLVVADSGNKRILIYDSVPNGQATPNRYLGQTEPEAAETSCDRFHLSRIADFTIADGSLFVSDTSHHRILVWKNWESAKSGAPANMVIGQPKFNVCTKSTAVPKAGDKYLNAPQGIWSNGTKLFVVDSGNNRVLGWNTLPTSDSTGIGTPPDFIVGLASDQIQMKTPIGITANEKMLFVSDADNNRILVWEALPSKADEFPTIVLGQNSFQHVAHNDDNQDGNSEARPTARTLSWPAGIFADERSLIVNDTGNARILVYTLKSEAKTDLFANSITPYRSSAGSGAPYGKLSSPLVALVKNQHGLPIAGASVTWKVLKGDGSFQNITSISDSNGLTESPDFTFGPSHLPNLISASIASGVIRSAEFTAIATDGFYVTSVGAENPSGRYVQDDKIKILITFSQPITLTGAAQLTVACENNISHDIDCSAASDNKSLVCEYTVQSGDISFGLDYASSSALQLSPGSLLQNSEQTDADLTLPDPGQPGSLRATKTITINDSIPICVAGDSEGIFWYVFTGGASTKWEEGTTATCMGWVSKEPVPWGAEGCVSAGSLTNCQQNFAAFQAGAYRYGDNW